MSSAGLRGNLILGSSHAHWPLRFRVIPRIFVKPLCNGASNPAYDNGASNCAHGYRYRGSVPLMWWTSSPSDSGHPRRYMRVTQDFRARPPDLCLSAAPAPTVNGSLRAW
jgi:hypothetical protein